MSQINFLQKDDRSRKQAEKLRQIVVPITTAVLVVYFLAISGLLAWWWWWSSKQTKSSAEYNLTASLVNAKKPEEVLYRRLEDRVLVINKYLNNREDLYEQTDFWANYPVAVVGYSVELEGNYSVTIESEDIKSVSEPETELKQRFENVSVKSLTWDGNKNLWTAVYFYGG